MIRNKLIRNASWIIVCRIVQIICGLIINMFTARYLGPSNFGIISYASSIVAFFVPIMQLGLGNVLVQEALMNPKEEGAIFGSAILTSVVGAIVCMIGVTSFVAIANAGEKETILVCALYSVILIGQALELIQFWFQAKYLAKYSSIVSLIAYLSVSIYKVYLLIAQKSIYWFAITNAIDIFLIAISLLFIYKRKGEQKLCFSWPTIKRMVGVSKHYITSSLMVTIFAQTDKIMITLMKGQVDNGYYSAAVVCAGITSFVFSAIIDSARPAILESKKESVAAFERDVSRLYCVVTYLALAQCLFMTGFAKLIITLMYGSAYSPAISALRIIVWYTTFSYYGAVRNVWILAEGKQKYLWMINLLGALANIVLNALLIPLFGIDGAAVASLITQFFTNVVVGYIVRPIKRNNYLILKGLDWRILTKKYTEI